MCENKRRSVTWRARATLAPLGLALGGAWRSAPAPPESNPPACTAPLHATTDLRSPIRTPNRCVLLIECGYCTVARGFAVRARAARRVCRSTLYSSVALSQQPARHPNMLGRQLHRRVGTAMGARAVCLRPRRQPWARRSPRRPRRPAARWAPAHRTGHQARSRPARRR